ncbi:MauE/DoxX family redox-associated membrane protein [Niabella sp. CJ426]|uniref:MauE/DoxX family redox-associated membrane protein n=1 Tax=Niabella sp. CJ426 TaxID=3393740 RepID=UPI003CFF5157
MESLIKENIKQQRVIIALTIFLLAMWIPVVIDKWTHFELFKSGMMNQPMPGQLNRFLVYLLPAFESLTVLLLIIGRTRMLGLWFSLVLMFLFTGYVGLALIGIWEKLPCSCGSVIKSLSWKQHFIFNLSFLILSAYGLKKSYQNKAPYISDTERQGLVGQKTML